VTQIVRRGKFGAVRYRRAMMILASSSGNSVPVIAKLVAADEDTVRDVILCFTPTNASWANPIEAHFGPLRQFTIADSNHPNHTVRTRALHAYLTWRDNNTRDPEVLAAQRRERARIRAEKGHRWDRHRYTTAA